MPGLQKLKVINFKPGSSEFSSFSEIEVPRPGGAGTPGSEGSGLVMFDEAQLARLRVSDPILTEISLGYKNMEAVYQDLFPVIPSPKMSGKFPAFGTEAFKRWDTKRALRSEVQRMEVQSGSVQLTLDEHSLGFGLDDNELHEWAGTPQQLINQRQNMVDDALVLEREYSAAGLATDTTLYATGNVIAPATPWSTSGVNPIVDCDAARNAIRKLIGRFPNRAVFSPTAWQIFINNDQIKDIVKYTQIAVMTEAIAAQLLRVEKVSVGNMVYGTGPGGGVGEADLTPGNIWEQNGTTGNSVVFAWVGSGWGVPSYGYTYNLNGFPIVTSYRWEIIKSQLYDSQQNYNVAITKVNAGAIIKTIT